MLFYSPVRLRVFRLWTPGPVAHRMPPLVAARRRSGVRTRVPAPWSRPRPRGALVDLANARYWIYGQSPLPRGRCVRHPLPARRGKGKARRRMVPASIEGLLMAITSPHVRLAPAVQDGPMMMVHGRDRLQAIAAGWPCARYHDEEWHGDGGGVHRVI